MGVYSAAGGLGTTMAFATGNAYPSITAAFGGVTAVGAVLLVLWLVFAKNPEKGTSNPGDVPEGHEKNSAATKRVLQSKNMWKVMICSGFAVGASLLINTYLTTAFIQEKGVVPAQAGGIGTLLNACLLIGGILAGMVIGKTGNFNMNYSIICFGGAALYLLSWFMPFGAMTYVFIALAGLISSGAVGVSFTRIPLLPKTGDFGPESIGTATGMNQAMLGIMSFVLPTIVATAAGNNYTMVFIIAAVFLVFVGCVGLTIPELGSKK